MKRLFDFTIAAIGLVLLSPILLIIAIVVRVTSAGPALYSGNRVGLEGRIFKMHKFRTMVVDAEKLGGSCTYEGDPRVTRTGIWLRKFKLDELPQLLNVLAGEMSLVGPRPEVLEYVQMFTAEERAILSVRPGITDWASIWDRDEAKALAGSPDPERMYQEVIRPEKTRLQLEYIRRRSFLTDLTILFATLRVLLLRPPVQIPVPTTSSPKQ
ncbi:MAG TPA: sugar transferase [Candidatus Solibacter sp.]|nr:sugar transferase [Candidatus Solibacter sp.]